jgi:hypothetical protein
MKSLFRFKVIIIVFICNTDEYVVIKKMHDFEQRIRFKYTFAL